MPLHNPAHWPEILYERFREKIGSLWALEARIKGACLGHHVRLHGRPIVSVARDSRLVLSEGALVCSGRRSNPLGCFQPCVLRTVTPQAELILGPRVGLSATVICAARSILVGEDTIIGAGAMVLDTDFHSLDPSGRWVNDLAGTARPIRIGKSVFVGARAIVLKGVTIGDRATVGAGSVVTKDVPADSVAAGNPARIVRSKIS